MSADEKRDERRPVTFTARLNEAVRDVESALAASHPSDPDSPMRPALAVGIVARVTSSGESVITTFKTGIVFLVCTNERPAEAPLPCCAARGGCSLLAAFRAELARRHYPRGILVVGSTCLTSCQYGPTVAVYPDAVWYGGVTEADVAELLDAHQSGRGPVERLLLAPEVCVW